MNYAKIKKDIRAVYDKLALYWGTDYKLHVWGNDELKEFALIVKKNGGGKVLDLGCGSGVQSKMLYKEGLAVVGLDLSPNMVKEAQRRAPKAKFVVGDASRMNFAKESFDGVYAKASLLHIPKRLVPQVLKEIYKILKEGGILYLALIEGGGERVVEMERYGIKVERFFSFYKKEEIRQFLKDAKFKIFSARSYFKKDSSQIWLQIFAKKI